MLLAAFPQLLPSGAYCTQVVLSQGLFVLKPQAYQLLGTTVPHSVPQELPPGCDEAPEYQQSPVATQPSCSPGPWPAGRPPQLEPATRLWLEFPWPLPSLQCTRRPASGFLSCPGLSELSSGFILEEAAFSLLIYSFPSGKVWDPWVRLGIRLWL